MGMSGENLGKTVSILKSITNRISGTSNPSSVIEAPPATSSNNVFRNGPRRDFGPII